MAWSTFLGYARPVRWGVRQALGRGGNEQSLGAIFEHLGSATSAVVDPDVSF
jgi:hypothetical protein